MERDFEWFCVVFIAELKKQIFIIFRDLIRIEFLQFESIQIKLELHIFFNNSTRIAIFNANWFEWER